MNAPDATAASHSQFLSTMTHELREPMNGVLGMARLLRETDLDEEQSGYVDAVIDSAEALVTIINDILDLSRIEADGFAIATTSTSLPAFFERIARFLQSRASAKGLELRLDIASGLPERARIDPGRLRQVLINIAGNAIKFTDHGHVGLAVESRARDGNQQHLLIGVSDTGPGIPQELQERLFTAYAQANTHVPRLYGGSGLGLMIAHRLVDAMGGRITIESEVGHGTRFLVALDVEIPDSENVANAGQFGLAGSSLLVADAQARSREQTCELTRLWGMQARGVANAAAARSALREAADRGQPFDIAVIDQALPDETGEQLGASLRQETALETLDLILVTASGIRGDAARAKAAGFNAYLPKPLSPSRLLDVLQQLHSDAHPELITIHTINEGKTPALRLLVVDDNPVNCKLASVMLQRAGHEVDMAKDGAEAVERVSSEPYDAIFMDVQMPVMDGLEATRRIRALSDTKCAAVPIVAVTANAMQGEDKPCLEAGMNAFVSKPIDRAALLSTLERLVA